jgi:signal transduction histidine kinase
MSSRPASIAAITLIQAALLVALIWTGLYWLNATNLQQLGQRARISAQLLAMSAALPLLADEPVRLDDLIAASGLDADLPHARVLDVEGVLLASRGDGDARRVGATPTASARRVCRFLANPDHVDGAAPIIVGAQVLGRVEVGLATAGLDALLCKAFWIALVLAGLQILLVAGFLRLLARRRGRELVQLQRAAEHDANAAKSRFLASMSHELRTPLNAILNLNELLLESGLDDEQRGYAVTASESACALLSIVNGVLDFSKIEAARVELAPRPSDPEEIVKSVIDLLAARAYAKEVPLVVYCDPSVPLQLRTDPGLVRQILLNLIGNAIKFTDQGAVRVHLVLSPDADALRIEVIDTGIGIAEDKQLNLFKEFVQADAADNRKYGGSGLGLVISRRLAHLLGGEIELRSALGEGSCFALVLPLPEAVDADSDLRAKAAAPLLDWCLTLWVDNAWVAEDLASQLAILGLDVEIVPPTAPLSASAAAARSCSSPSPAARRHAAAIVRAVLHSTNLVATARPISAILGGPSPPCAFRWWRRS